MPLLFPRLVRRPGLIPYRRSICQAVLMQIAVAASLLAVAAWVYLVAGHGGFWRTDQRLPRAAGDPASWPAVVAVIPARDEAPVLPETLPTLLTQDYPGRLTIVLVDDESTDGTADVASKLSAAVWPAARAPAAPPAGHCGRRAAAAGHLRRAASAGLGGQGVGDGPGAAGGRLRRLCSVHRRRYRLPAGNGQRPGPGRRGRATGSWSRRWRCYALTRLPSAC